MTRSAILGLVGALLLSAIVATVLLIQPRPPATQAEAAARLAAELRCPDCESLSVAESRTAAATAIRQEIDAQLAAGRTPDEMRDSFVARYGEWILLEPRGTPLWLVAPLAVLTGLVLLAWWFVGRRGLHGATAGQPSDVSDSERARIRHELDQLDG